MDVVIARGQYDERPVVKSDLSFEGDKGLTKQSDAKDCDINLIFKRLEKCGTLSEMIVREGSYGDFSSVPDFQESLHIVRHAQEQFDNLDVTIRNRFENDPVKFLEFVNDPKNLDEMENLGLLKSEVVEARKKARYEESVKKEKEIADKKAADERVLIEKIKAEISA